MYFINIYKNLIQSNLMKNNASQDSRELNPQQTFTFALVTTVLLCHGLAMRLWHHILQTPTHLSGKIAKRNPESYVDLSLMLTVGSCDLNVFVVVDPKL